MGARILAYHSKLTDVNSTCYLESMSRRPASDVVVPYVIAGTTFKIATSTLNAFPGAPAFIKTQLAKGVSGHVAGEYARLIAKVIREGRVGNPELIAERSQRTAINAYWAWVEAAYYVRVQPVIRAFAHSDVREGVEWLRVGSLVPPTPGKKIPRLTKMPTITLDSNTQAAASTAAEFGWFETNAWTLHVPRSAKVPMHTDPCIDCTPIELTPELLEVIAKAFEDAWGHRDLQRVPAECFLFGQPPRSGSRATTQAVSVGKIVALLPPSVLADNVTQLRGYVTEQEDAFRSRLTEGEVDVLVISREAAGKHFAGLLHAVRLAWEADAVAVREAAEASLTMDGVEAAP